MAVLLPDINEEMPGEYLVEFTNGKTRFVLCQRVVVTSQAFPIWLDAADGTHYNFQNILSLQKRGS